MSRQSAGLRRGLGTRTRAPPPRTQKPARGSRPSGTQPRSRPAEDIRKGRELGATDYFIKANHTPQEVVEKVIRDCKVGADKLAFILTPTHSLAGMVQIVARVLEVALHKVHALSFPLQHIVDGAGSAPLPPPCKDFIEAMGRTNDAILFGGQVQLFVSCSDNEASDLAQKLPSSASRDYGKRFAQIFKDCAYDFYKIAPMLFAPAQVMVSNLGSGNSFRAGKLNAELLDTSFGGAGG